MSDPSAFLARSDMAAAPLQGVAQVTSPDAPERRRALWQKPDARWRDLRRSSQGLLLWPDPVDSTPASAGNI
jgi:hypothetical protein